MSTILGLDVGEHKIGVAIGQTETRFAFARPPILVKDWREAWPKITDVIMAEQPVTIVVGWPINSDGSVGPQAKIIEDFVRELKGKTKIPIVLADERLTTQAVQHEQAGRSLGRGQEDSLAAQLMLETYVSMPHDAD